MQRKICTIRKKALPTRPRKPYNSWHDDGLRAAGGVHPLVRPLTATPPNDPAGLDEAAEIAAMTPLALMLALMREKWAQGDRDGAVKLACAAAPYLHARRSAAADNTIMTAEAHRLNDAELCRRLAGADGGMESSAEDT